MFERFRSVVIHRGMADASSTMCVAKRIKIGDTWHYHGVMLYGMEPFFWSRRQLLAYAKPHFDEWEKNLRAQKA